MSPQPAAPPAVASTASVDTACSHSASAPYSGFASNSKIFSPSSSHHHHHNNSTTTTTTAADTYTFSTLTNSSTSSLDSTIGISQPSASLVSAPESDRGLYHYLPRPASTAFGQPALHSSPAALIASKPLPEIAVHPDTDTDANPRLGLNIDFASLSGDVVHLALSDLIATPHVLLQALPSTNSASIQSHDHHIAASACPTAQQQPRSKSHQRPASPTLTPSYQPHTPPVPDASTHKSLASRVFRSRSPAATAKSTTRPRSLASQPSFSPSPAQPASIQPTRKPSPGLAARLKALGFASSASKTTPVATTIPVIQDRPGGLVQHQARQLDESHQAGSAAAPISVRRSRPWKGTVRDISAAIANTLSRSASFDSLTSPRSGSDSGPAFLSSPTNDDFNIGLSSPTSASSNFLAPPQSPSALAFSVSLQDLRSNMSPSGSEAASNTTSPATSSVSLPESHILPPLSPICLPEIHTTPPLNSNLPTVHTPHLVNMDTTSNHISTHQINGKSTNDHFDSPEEHRDDRNTASFPPSLTLDTHTSTEAPPPPPPKDTPPAVSAVEGSFGSEYFVSRHGRAGSIYTLSRASFTNQLAQLTSLQLPDADSLSNKVAAIPTAHAANNALINAAEQIRGWIAQAADVISGLDSDDDVEWAAAAGREGLDEVEKAIVRFEDLINIYVSAIEDLQRRHDIGDVSPNDLNKAVVQMEHIMEEWMKIRRSLNTAKEQVEIAMEWEELWNSVLGDIQSEMDELSRLVFEMEERRHKSTMTSNENVDIGDLETIVEEAPNVSRIKAQSIPMSPESPGASSLALDDSSLLALFARMQPLRASLDFLPMRLSVFENRAQKAFPTSCDELEMRRTALDGSYKKLEKDAECLRKELGEDRWVTVFRNAGRQAEKMYESVHRSVDKLQEAIGSGCHQTSPSVMSKKIESYEAKKMHYGPAIERVLSIIDKGVKDRLTVNGEILCLHSETQAKWANLKRTMASMDVLLEEVQSESRGQQLRDSISSLLSSDHTSTIGSSHETPSSSPPSSVFMSSLGFRPRTPGSNGKRVRAGTVGGAGQQSYRNSFMPSPSPQLSANRKAAQDRLYGPSTPGSNNSTKVTTSRLARPPSTSDLRPKWNGSTNISNLDTGHNFVPLTLTTPSPYAKRSPSVTPGASRPVSTLTPNSNSGSRLPKMRSFSMSPRSTAASPAPGDTPTRTSVSRLSFRDRINNAGPATHAQQTVLPKTRAPSRTGAASANPLGGREIRRASYQPRMPGGDVSSPPSRPASSLAFNSRRASVLPVPTSQLRHRAGSADGRSTPSIFSTSRTAASAATRKPVEPKDTKPRWRF
ncbi:uncharacterized protein BROUX77_001941 [Berkeleyomyces rouxiae]|uniref:uncharacterized protein n=1 Tax=Berkeleyomyces rouxiae TaxID=2035830 RepID=UPI003B7C32B8